jgi:hypothetical protein
MSNAKISKKANHKDGEYNLVKGPFPYHAREDQTILPANTLVSPSRNVVNNTASRLQLVRGYVLDGVGSTVIDSGILSNYDFINFKGDTRNLRAGFLSSALNDGKLQYRYVTGTSTVNWVNLKTSLTSINLSFCTYADTTNKVKDVLWVDSSNNIFLWNGAVTTFASATATTVTKQGTNTWAQEGFSTTGTRSIVIGGVSATYTGGETTTTLTGVSVDFSASAVGSIVHQDVVVTPLSSMTGILTTFAPTVIGCGRQNQVYLGSSNSNIMYISKVADYTSYAFTTPVRIAGEGYFLILDAAPVKFIAQEVHGDDHAYDMWISTGKDRWSIVRTIVNITYDTSGVAKSSTEQIELIAVKSASLQGTQTERLCTKMKNHIVFIGNDNVCNALGYISYQFVPVIEDLSYPIINDMNGYDFTNGSIFYHKNYIYVAVPKSGLVRIYNMTDQTKEQYSNYNPQEQVGSDQPFFWEAPVTYPVSGFYVVNGEIYGHGFNTSESYKLFTSGSFNGQLIDANASLAFTDLDDRTQSKGSNEVWVEGYIKQNTILNVAVNEDLDAFQTSQVSTINGSDNTIVGYGAGSHALGKDPLGSRPLGGTLTTTNPIPAWFHVVKTYVQNSYYLEQLSFSTRGVDLDWQLITFGTNAKMTTEGNNEISQ